MINFDFFSIFLFLPVCSVFLSFFSFSIVFCFGRYLGDKGSVIFSIFNTFVSFVLSVFYIVVVFYPLFLSSVTGFLYKLFPYSLFLRYSQVSTFSTPNPEFIFGTWFDVYSIHVPWGFYFDTLSIIMIFVILFITLAVQVYCIDYMFGDPFVSKFYSYLSLFSFFMLFLVSSNNYLQLFLGWEGVGLTSFLLISFWTTRKDAVLAGLKAMIVNRIGDVFFLFSSVILISIFKTLTFSPLFFILDSYFASGSQEFHFELYLFGFSLFFAAMAKSAQLGLHTWLPDAMEGPTPVSALIHAATMVTAGVFVIVRSSSVISNLPYLLDFITLIGGLTALFGSTVACVQYDLKKVVAYSTCSQLGYMMIACGTCNYTGAMFHLFTHAFFKALLFLSAGSVIHALGNEQDMRRMGGLFRVLPFTYCCFFIGSLSLAGFPFFSGFYSKDNILEVAFLSGTSSGFLGFIFGLLSVFFTAFYSFRLLYLVFFGFYRGSRLNFFRIHEPSFYMTGAMFSLLVPTIFFGFLFFPFFVGEFSSLFWSSAVFIPTFESSVFSISSHVRQAPLLCSVAGVLFSYLVYHLRLDFTYVWGYSTFFKFLSRKWYFDDFYNTFACYFIKFLYFNYWLVFEKFLFDFFGPRGVSYVFSYLSSLVDKSARSRFINSFQTIFVVGVFLAIILVYFYNVSFVSLSFGSSIITIAVLLLVIYFICKLVVLTSD